MRGLDADCFRQPPREKAARLERRPVLHRCRTVPLRTLRLDLCICLRDVGESAGLIVVASEPPRVFRRQF